VIIPTFNYGHYIVNAIESVLNQGESAESLQIIVVDDGSTDDTLERLADYIKENKIIYAPISNSGKAYATMLGIQFATGDIIFTLDADDYFLPGKIAKTLEVYKKLPAVVHVASPALMIHESGMKPPMPESIPADLLGRPIPGQQLMLRFLRQKMLFGGGSTFSARADVLKKIYLPDAIDMYTDEWLVMSALHAGDSFFLGEALSVWRIHKNNFSLAAHSNQEDGRQLRLQNSSVAVLDAIKVAGMPAQWRHLYYLKHQVRNMVWKEMKGTKSFSDRWNFLIKICRGYHFTELWNYRAFYRLIK